MDELFKHPGKLLKGMALGSCVVTWIVGIVLSFMYVNDDEIRTGLFILIGCIIGGWLGNLLLYGIGELFENVNDIRNHILNEEYDEEDDEDYEDEENDEDQ